jgi:hypothetical protein
VTIRYGEEQEVMCVRCEDESLAQKLDNALGMLGMARMDIADKVKEAQMSVVSWTKKFWDASDDLRGSGNSARTQTPERPNFSDSPLSWEFDSNDSGTFQLRSPTGLECSGRVVQGGHAAVKVHDAIASEVNWLNKQLKFWERDTRYVQKLQEECESMRRQLN